VTSSHEQSAIKRRMRTQAISISLAVSPFGVAFGVACSQADLSVLEAGAFSVLVFTGGSQFAAVGVLRDNGSAIAAVIAGLLLAIRSLAYGLVMAPSLQGPRWKQAIWSQLMIDEAMAVAVTHEGSDEQARRLQRYGYLWCGGSVFVLWNLATLLGTIVGSSSSSWITTFGVDATIPASFLALVWPRLHDPVQRWVALGGALIAAALIPVAPPGLPIIAGGIAVGVAPLVQSRRQVYERRQALARSRSGERVE
jgi:4-azaleucine resistance transporter AzlC